MWYQQQDLGHVDKSSCFVLQDGQLSPSNHTASLPPCCLCSADPAYLQPNFPLMQRPSSAFSDVHARTVWLWSQKGQPNPLQGGGTEVHHGGRHPDHQQGWQQLVAGPGGRLIPGVSGPDPLPWAAGMVSHWWTRTHSHHRELPSFHNLSCCVSFLLLNGANLAVFLAQWAGGRGNDALTSLTGYFMAKGAWLVLPASTDLCGHKCFPSACKAGRVTGTQSPLPQRPSEPWSSESCRKSESEVAQSCPTLCNPMDCSPPGSSIHGILQARGLEWVAIVFSRGSFWPRDRTWVSHIIGRLWALLKTVKF